MFVMVTKFYFPYQPFWEYFDIVRRSYDLISTTFWYYIHKWIYQFFGFPIFTVKHLNDGLLPVKAQNMFKVFKICILKGIIWFQNSLIPSSRRRRHRSLWCPLCMESWKLFCYLPLATYGCYKSEGLSSPACNVWKKQ